MSIRMLTAVFAMFIVGSFSVKAQDGFIAWAEGSGCDRELKINELKGGIVGEMKTAVTKGPGADIQVVISYDGKWMAFARANSSFNGRYGQCDYHAWDKFDVYIARIDGALPAEPKLIGHGYYPTWGDNSGGAVKTLYFTKYIDQTIQKTTISPDGIFTAPITHATCPKKMTGTTAHTQGSPDGRYIAFRPAGMKVWDILKKVYVEGAGGSGQHPSWGPNGYLIWAKNQVCRIKNGKTTMIRRSAGLGAYHYGMSNDGKWIIGRMGGSGQNGAGSIEFKPVDTSNDGWKPGASTKVGEGTWCDIHINVPPATTVPSKPTGLTLESFNGASCQFTWDAVFGYGVTYTIYRDGIKIANVSTNRYIDNSLVVNQQYTYAVSAINAIGESGKSDALLVNYFPPAIPAGLTLVSVDYHSCKFTWSAVVASGVTYNVYRDGIKIANVSLKEFRDSALTANSLYVYMVSTVNVFGESGKSGPLLVSTPAAPPHTLLNGFVAWAEGSGCERELKINKVTDGKVGEMKTAVKKGAGADIEVVISYDGKWIAFARANSNFKGKYGECDYHAWDKFNVYIARIDGALPAEPKLIGHGYYPTWGDDSDKVFKTLYYTKYIDQTIQRTTISPEGAFTPPITYATCPKKMTGTNAHTQGSPDGQYIALRPAGIRVWDILKKEYVEGAGGSGQHPSWGPNGYLIWAKNQVCRIKNGKTTMIRRSAGLGAYHYGMSNDGKWIIGRIGGSGQNGAGSIEFKPVDTSSDGWKTGSSTIVGLGTWCDIHADAIPIKVIPKDQLNKLDKASTFNARVSASATGLQLIIESMGLAGYSAGLYDMQGMQKAFMAYSNDSRNIIPLQGIANGRYVLKINTHKMSTQKTISISK